MGGKCQDTEWSIDPNNIAKDGFDCSQYYSHRNVLVLELIEKAS